MKTDICYIVSHGFAARMLMQTDLLGKLVKGGKSVALIAPDKNDANLVQYCSKNNIPLYEFDEKGKYWGENYMFKRKYYLEDIRKNPALWEKHVYSIFHNTSLHPLRRIRPFYYYLIYRLIPFFKGIRNKFENGEKKYLFSQQALDLLNQIAPKKLVATYPVNLNEAILLHSGNAIAGIETWIHLLSWDNITCKGKFPEIASKYIAWGPVMQEEFIEHYGIPERDIYACGVPHFDLHVSKEGTDFYTSYIQELKLDPQIPYIIFAMSSPRFAPFEIDIVEALAAKIEAGDLGPVQLVVRPHPQNVTGNMADLKWIGRLQKLAELKRTAVDFPQVVKSKLSWSMQQQDMVRFSNLIAGSCMVLNSGSTVSIEALIHEKPVILTSFDADKEVNYWRSARRLKDYVHLRKVVEMKGVLVSHSYDELWNLVSGALTDPKANEANRKHTVFRECGIVDGHATDRIVAVLTNN